MKLQSLIQFVLLLIAGAVFAHAQSATGRTLRLEELEQMALQRNPGLAQATAGVRTAEALRRIYRRGYQPGQRLQLW
jgi:outer membrane protein TolC